MTEIVLYDFDTSTYAMFSLGEVQEEIAEFQMKALPGRWGTGRAGRARRGASRAYEGAKRGAGQTYQRVKGHTRNVAGKGLQFVKGSFRKAGAAIKANPRLAAAGAVGTLAAGGGAAYLVRKRRKKKRRRAA